MKSVDTILNETVLTSRKHRQLLGHAGDTLSGTITISRDYPFHPPLQYILINHKSDNLLSKISTSRRLLLHNSPKPVDTSDLLTNELNGIVELLPKNTHENWASIRMSQWRYGSERNNEYKEHRVLSHLKNCRNLKKSMIARLFGKC